MYNKQMEYYHKINKWYDKGLDDGLKRKPSRPLCLGAFYQSYVAGYNQGLKLKRGAPLRLVEK